MTWPLTYRDSINLRGKACGAEAYFLCQIKCKILSNFYSWADENSLLGQLLISIGLFHAIA